MSTPSLWALVPAAGIGSRMAADCPKQYLPLLDKTVLEQTLERLLQVTDLVGVVVAVNAQDDHWQRLTLSRHPKVQTVIGGRERADSVIAGLRYIREVAKPDQGGGWVLVHDAARPCVRLSHIERLVAASLAATAENAGVSGGILAQPIADTVKRSQNGQLIDCSENRSQLWLAHTPQFFPVDTLFNAYSSAQQAGAVLTDEASAIEACGGSVLLVPDRRDNIKITVAEDLSWAEFVLSQEKNKRENL